jgi:hypothetical protein
MSTMLLLALATSGLISKFKIKNYPFPALAHIIKRASLSAPSRRQPSGPGPYFSMLVCIGHKSLLKHPKQTPCGQGCLGADLDGEPAQATYNYRIVVGQVGYLKGNSRPDIEFAYSQCARFSNEPKRSHEKALKHIGIYLKGTRENGLILRPKDIENLPIDCYVDANFAGLWGFEDKQDPTSVTSRTGFIIFVAYCPVLWQSKLKTDIATSIMEAE